MIPLSLSLYFIGWGTGDSTLLCGMWKHDRNPLFLICVDPLQTKRKTSAFPETRQREKPGDPPVTHPPTASTIWGKDGAQHGAAWSGAEGAECCCGPSRPMHPWGQSYRLYLCLSISFQNEAHRTSGEVRAFCVSTYKLLFIWRVFISWNRRNKRWLAYLSRFVHCQMDTRRWQCCSSPRSVHVRGSLFNVSNSVKLV